LIRARTAIEQYFSIQGNEMLIGGTRVSDIVGEFNTPVYAYDVDVLEQTYRRFRTGLTDDVLIFYSLKANPSLGLCSIYHRLGAGAEIASLGELKVALSAGFPPENIIYAGPGKSREELEAAVGKGILAINVESIHEIKAIEAISGRLKKQTGICIRVNPKLNLTDSHQKMGGQASPFGIDEEHLPAVIDVIKDTNWVELKGIHVYVGNQIFDYQLALDNIDNTIRIAHMVAALTSNSAMEIVNFGGGLGIPYYERQQDFEEYPFQEKLNQYIGTAKAEDPFKQTKFILELGRYLVARCGVFLTRVLYIKESRGKRFAVVDGGMHVNSIATGNFGQKLRRKFLLCAPQKLQQPAKEVYDIVGPLCTPMDTFGHNYQAPGLQCGDIIAVLFVGAYGLTGSPTHFLSHLACPEISASRGQLRLLRRRETIDHVISQQNLYDFKPQRRTSAYVPVNQ
jgi:diaminopimelate decarboxylase